MRAQIVRESAHNLDLSSKCTGQARNALPQDLARGAKQSRLQCGLSFSGPRSARSNGKSPLGWMRAARGQVRSWDQALSLARTVLRQSYNPQAECPDFVRFGLPANRARMLLYSRSV